MSLDFYNACLTKSISYPDAYLNNEEFNIEEYNEQEYVNRYLPTIVVDTREFLTVLPPYLYKAGLNLVPQMLSVGDYIIDTDLCIERKAVDTGDLYESMRTGRLLHQIRRMTKFYKKPVLLLEFEKTKGMTFGEFTEDTMRLLCILKINFPQLMILWAKTPKEGAKMIAALKEDRNDLDLLRTKKIGKNTSAKSSVIHLLLGLDEEQLEGSHFPLEILLKIEGVTADLVSLILEKVKSIHELAMLSLKKLQNVVGEITGKVIYNFLHETVPKSLVANQEDICILGLTLLQ